MLTIGDAENGKLTLPFFADAEAACRWMERTGGLLLGVDCRENLAIYRLGDEGTHSTRLTSLELDVLMRRYPADGIYETYSEIARSYRVSRYAIQKIEQRAIRKLLVAHLKGNIPEAGRGE